MQQSLDFPGDFPGDFLGDFPGSPGSPRPCGNGHPKRHDGRSRDLGEGRRSDARSAAHVGDAVHATAPLLDEAGSVEDLGDGLTPRTRHPAGGAIGNAKALDETKAEIALRIRRCESTLTTGAGSIDFMQDELG